MQAVAEFVEQCQHLIVREERGTTPHRVRKIASEVGDRGLQLGAVTALGDRIVYPGAAALDVARVQVHIELPDERSRGIADLVEAHVLVPARRVRGVDADAIERLGDTKEALDGDLLGEILLYLLL